MIYHAYDEKVRAVPYDRANKWAYREQVTAVDKEFKAALAKEYLPDYPEAATNHVWNMAWDMGHASGYSEVENYYMDLAILVVDVVSELEE